MDPNRHNIDHILKLPTPRLLNYYKGLRREGVSEFVRDCYGYFCDDVDLDSNYAEYHLHEVQRRKRTLALMSILKEELDKREHVFR